MPRPTGLSESLGDYLESIHHLVHNHPVARVRDIAERMKVRKPSVTEALKLLAEKGLVNYDPYRFVTFTPRGERVAHDLVRRHETLRQFLEGVLAVDNTAAGRNACHMEHAIEPQVLEKLVKFLEFLDRCPRTGEAWKRGADYGCGRGADAKECGRCLGGELARSAAKV